MRNTSIMDPSSEKGPVPSTDSQPSSTEEAGAFEPVNVTSVAASNRLQRFANRLDAMAGVEARGIERVPPELRERKVSLKDYLGVGVMWFSIK